MDFGTNGSSVARVQFGPGLWKKAAVPFERRAAHLPNLYQPGSGWRSFFQFAALEYAHWALLPQRATNRSAAVQGPALLALGKLLSSAFPDSPAAPGPSAGEETFRVPAEEWETQSPGTTFILACLGQVFRLSDHWFPKYSWPWTASREMGFVLINKSTYTSAELDRIRKSPDTGPVGCLVIARLLQGMNRSAALAFAYSGESRLDAKSFLSDCNLFLRGDADLARGFERVAGALRAMPEAEVAQLVSAMPEAEGILLRESAAALRSQPDQPLEIVLRSALTNYWDRALRAKVRHALREILTRPAPTDRSAPRQS